MLLFSDMQDECSFVSLRDVDRTLQVMMWFYIHEALFDKIDHKAQEILEQQHAETEEYEEDGEEEEIHHEVSCALY